VNDRAEIHIVDDDDAIRDSLAFLLDASGWRTCLWPSAEAFLDGAGAARVACLITDVRMPGLSGLDLVQRLNARGFTAPIIVMTGHGDIPLAVDAMKAGVVDFLEKPINDELLMRALEAAVSQAPKAAPDDPEIVRLRQRFKALSPRERDVMTGVVAGKPNKVIAQDLGISPRTVEVYRAGLMTKTGAGSLSELVRMALTLGH
jgi:two-component system response regulator FixJ